MFGQIPETPYDLQFRVLGIPARVHPGFWIIAAVVAWYPGNLGIVAVGIACVFLSILVHELGHALMAKRFGWPPNILLYHFGGLAYYTPTWGQTRAKSIVISLAGPGAGFVLYGLVRGLHYYYDLHHPAIFDSIYVRSAFYFLEFCNLWWGILNLLPIFPLDGGQVAREICQGINHTRGLEWTFKIGIITGVAVALGFFYWERPENLRQGFTSLLFLFLAFNNFQMLQQISGRGGGYY